MYRNAAGMPIPELKNQKQKIAYYVEYITRCKAAYYNTDSPLVSDALYDTLEESLRAVAPGHPLLDTVGAPVEAKP